MKGVRSRSGGGLLVSLLPVVAVLAAGCDTARPPRIRVPPPFAEQLAAVREGRSDRIELPTPPTPEEWESLRGRGGLRELVLHRGVADDGRAEILASLPDLERLVLRRSPLSDTGFAAIARCRALEDLNVPQAACTVAGIESLAKLPGLRSLRLGGPNLTGPEVARAIARLPVLKSLHLIDVAIGDEGLTALAELATLQNLYLDAAGVSDAAWERCFADRKDVHVHVDQAHHDRDPRGGHD